MLLDRLKSIKYKGKGRERQYLERYMVTYQLWSNRLWPKAKLDDFMLMARNTSRDPQIRRYCRDLIDREKEEKMFPRMNQDAGHRNDITEERSDRSDRSENASNARSEHNSENSNENNSSGENRSEDTTPRNPAASEPENDNPPDDIPPDDELDAFQHDSEAERVQAEMEHDLYGDFDF